MTVATRERSEGVQRPAGSIYMTEIFSAIQGEGALVGERQVFARLAGCNIRCAYCDQPEALERRPGPCRVERTPGRRDWEIVESPLRVEVAARAIERLWRALPHHSVSCTGGEPLFQAAGLEALLGELARRDMSTFLETNGTLTAAFDRLADLVDHVSMDLKLPSVDGERVSLAIQESFLARTRAKQSVYCKIVLGPRTSDEELAAAVEMVHRVAPATTIFLQPVTPFAAVSTAPSPAQVLSAQELALRIHPRVRVVPQTHKLIGQL
jgi:organic radical activating enzyme